jgi:PAS domain S-box-containing protein
MKRIWLWTILNVATLALGVAAAQALFPSFEAQDLHRPLAAAVVLLLVFAVNAGWLAVQWLRLRQDLRRLAAGVDSVPDASPRHAWADDYRTEARILAEAMDRLRSRFGDTLDQVVRYGEELRRLQFAEERPLGLADRERGRSRSSLRRSPAGDLEMVARLTPELAWMAASSKLLGLLGRPLGELTGKPLASVVHPEDSPQLPAIFKQVAQKGEGHNILFRLVDQLGQPHYVQVDVMARYQPDGALAHFRCHLLDVTERVTAERELLRRTEELQAVNQHLRRVIRQLERLKEGYRDLYHHSPVMYFSLDQDGRLLRCNETMVATLGYARDEVLGRPFAEIMTSDSRRALPGGQSWFLGQQEIQLPVQLIRKDGGLIDTEIRSVAVHDSAGRFLRTRSVAQDVTEQKRLADQVRERAEQLKKANEDLLRINGELDDFTYVVSHDLKEPLRTIDVFSNVLAGDYREQLGENARQYLDHLVHASRRLKALIDDLLALSRAGRVVDAIRPCDLEAVLGLVQGDLADLIQRKKGMVRVDGPLPLVLADPARLQQLLANLISNGLKYNEHPRPEVVFGCGADLAHPQAPDWLVFFVRDNGIGIDAAYHEQIFKVFRRLHRQEDYEGTGAGLAICKKIVEAHGGKIWVESTPEQGSTFYFTLQRAS